jgi:hypothetical protein
MNIRMMILAVVCGVLSAAVPALPAKDHPTIRVWGAPPAMPPWMDEHPYRVAPPGHWTPREPDWRTVDWSGPTAGYELHRRTQAHSLEFERKYVAPAKPSRMPYHNIGILEFVPSARVCGPGIR